MIVKDKLNDFIIDEESLRNLIYKAIEITTEINKEKCSTQLRSLGILPSIIDMPLFQQQDIADSILAAEMKTMEIDE
jgi:hypothetical protein